MGQDNTEAILHKFRESLMGELEELLDRKLEEQRDLFNQRIADELKPIKDNQAVFQRSIDIIDSDMATDRQNFENWSVRLGKVETVIDQIKQNWERHTRRLMDTIGTVTEKSLENIAEKTASEVGPAVKDALDNFVMTKPPIQKKPKDRFRWLKPWKWFKF